MLVRGALACVTLAKICTVLGCAIPLIGFRGFTSHKKVLTNYYAKNNNIQ